MSSQFYELCEMVCSVIFVVGLVKGIYLGTLIIINFFEIKQIKEKKENEIKKE